MKPHVVAFCPGHISGYFKRIEGETIATTGSIGAGVVISEGVTATVEPAYRTSVCIKRKSFGGTPFVVSSGSPLLEDVMKNLNVTASVVTECILPIGAGFGLSAAALLATITALNHLYDMGMNTEEIAQHAHAAEVTHRTGLGDVAACQGGGRVIRSGPGIHGLIERRFDMPEPLYAVSFGSIHTPTVLGSSARMDHVSSAFPDTIPESREDFFTLSRHFTEMSGLITKEVRDVTRICDAAGILSSMTMLGNGIFAYGRKARGVLLPFGHVYELRISDTGSHILEDPV
ncbi:MAG: pantoate kinase [Methanoregula sp.]|jgi:pantoate kinase|nr:pantoate kinase [Methanoregula sp.]